MWCAIRRRSWARGSTPPTRRPTAATTTSPPRCCSRRCSRRAASGWCWPRRWWSTGRAATSARSTVLVDPLPRTRADLDAGVFEHRCPVCGQQVRWRLVDEDAPLRPRSLYAASKTAQEHYALAWAESTGGSVVALRYHNVYGPGMPRDTPYSGVAAIFRSELEAGDVPRVFEDGGQMRDFVHVDDVAAANVAAVDAEPGWLLGVQRVLGAADLDPGGGHRAVRDPRRRAAARHRSVPQRRRAPHRRRPGPRRRGAGLSRGRRPARRAARVRLRAAAGINARAADGDRYRHARGVGSACVDVVAAAAVDLLPVAGPGAVGGGGVADGRDVVLDTEDGIRLGAWYFPVGGQARRCWCATATEATGRCGPRWPSL